MNDRSLARFRRLAVRSALGTAWLMTLLLGILVAPEVSAQGGSATTFGTPDRAEVLSAEVTTTDGQPRVVYRLRWLDGAAEGQSFTIGEGGGAVSTHGNIFRSGDRVFVVSIDKIDGTKQYLITDYDRRGGLWWLVALFVAAVIWFSRWRGTRSLVGLAISLVVIIGWIVPLITTGSNPVLVTIIGSTVILAVGFLLTEGLSRLMWAAALGTTVTMVIIGALSAWAIRLTSLTGNASEEAFYVQNIGSGAIDLRGLLLAGIIIGTLGILDDMAISQAATVAELRRANPRQSRRELFNAAMRVGQKHLAAIINTLTLAYAGSALPLLVLFNANPQPVSMTLNGENIATEIVRSIVGSLGLILALPITTAVAVWLNVRSDHPHHEHHH